MKAGGSRFASNFLFGGNLDVAKATTAVKTKIKTASTAKASAKAKPRRGKGSKAGSLAPDFRLRDGNGKIHRLAKYQGQKVVLYFYPKDDTPGCTVEAEDFNKNIKKIKAKGALILGVSPDNEVSHKRFSEKLELEFPLLADPDAEVATKYSTRKARSRKSSRMSKWKATPRKSWTPCNSRAGSPDLGFDPSPSCLDLRRFLRSDLLHLSCKGLFTPAARRV